MYVHGQVFDAAPEEGDPRMVDVGNAPLEAIARDKAAAERDGRPRRYFTNREEYDGVIAEEKRRAAEKAAAEKAAAEKVEADRIAAKQAAKDAKVES